MPYEFRITQKNEMQAFIAQDKWKPHVFSLTIDECNELSKIILTKDSSKNFCNFQTTN